LEGWRQTPGLDAVVRDIAPRNDSIKDIHPRSGPPGRMRARISQSNDRQRWQTPGKMDESTRWRKTPRNGDRQRCSTWEGGGDENGRWQTPEMPERLEPGKMNAIVKSQGSRGVGMFGRDCQRWQTQRVEMAEL
jgi:hypothetical protein